MSKRRHEDDLAPAKVARGDGDGNSERRDRLAAQLAALNSQFASWVAVQHRENPLMFWNEGVKDYLEHAEALLMQYEDAVETSLRGAGPAAGGEKHVSFLVANGTPAPKPMQAALPLTPFSFGGAGGATPGSASPGSAGTGPAGGFSFGNAAGASNTPSAPSPAPAMFGFGAGPSATTTDLAGAAEKASTHAARPPAEESGPAPAPAATGLTVPGTSFFSSNQQPAGSEGLAGKGVGASGGFSFGAPAPAAGGSSEAAGPVVPKPFTFGAPSSTAPASVPAAVASSAAPTLPFSFGAVTSMAPAASSASSGAAAAASIFGGAAPAATGSFSFGATPANAAAAGTGAAGAASSSAAAAFTFGAAASTTISTADGATAPAPFSFGGTAAAPAFSFGGPASTGFSFGAAAPAAEDEGGEEDPQAPADEYAQNASLQTDDTLDILYKGKAKLSLPVRDEAGKISTWEHKATGQISIRKAKAEGAKPFIALYTESGRSVYMATIPKTMRVVVVDKTTSLAFTTVCTLDGNSTPVNQAVTFKFGKDKHKEFDALIKECQAALPEA